MSTWSVWKRVLPHQSSIDEDNIDEERRLAYVGITRAQKELTFTLCKERRQYGELVRRNQADSYWSCRRMI